MVAWLKSADFGASLRAVAAVLGFHIAPEGGLDASGGDLGEGFAVKGGFTAVFALGFGLAWVVLGAAAVAWSAVAKGVEAACSTAGAGSVLGVEEELLGIFQCGPLPFVGFNEDCCVGGGVGVAAAAGAGVEVAGDDSVE